MLMEPSVGVREGKMKLEVHQSLGRWWEDGGSNSADISSSQSVLVTLTLSFTLLSESLSVPFLYI